VKITSNRLLKKGLLLTGVIIIILVWLGFGETGFINLYRMDLERQETLERIREVSEQNRILIEEVDRMRTDMDYVESVAREELGLVKPNEVIYRFRKGETRDRETGSEVQATTQALKY
jgi:cell division protein FtsB